MTGTPSLWGTGRDIRVNLCGAINVTERYAFQPQIRSVLFNASASGVTGDEFPEYAASKAGVIGYMRSCAKRLAAEWIYFLTAVNRFCTGQAIVIDGGEKDDTAGEETGCRAGERVCGQGGNQQTVNEICGIICVMRVVGASKRTKRFAAIVMMAVASFVAVARGSVLCLCDEDPDDCGRACHECGVPRADGIAHADDCLHLNVAAVDLALAAGGARLPVVSLAPQAIPQIAVLSTVGSDVVPCATSPPPWLSVYSSYSTRLFPRS